MKKKADWPIKYCEMCLYLSYSPIRDVICSKAKKYLWTNSYMLTDGSGKTRPYEYMPEWCPLEKWVE